MRPSLALTVALAAVLILSGCVGQQPAQETGHSAAVQPAPGEQADVDVEEAPLPLLEDNDSVGIGEMI
jgi:hypothetical protein